MELESTHEAIDIAGVGEYRVLASDSFSADEYLSYQPHNQPPY
jgi:hypothetical protein